MWDRAALRFSLPQALTASRVLLGAWALLAAIFQQPELAAKLITLGAVTDGLDGPLARRLKVASEFGALFDCYADYLCYIVAPAVLSLRLIDESFGLPSFLALGLPLLAGALRYSAIVLRRRVEVFEDVGVPGLATVFYAFLIVTSVLLRSGHVLGPDLLRYLLVIIVPPVSCAMVLPIRYPKLMKYRTISIPILAGFSIMPFAFTTVLAGIALSLGFLYTIAAPFFIPQRRMRTASGQADRREGTAIMLHQLKSRGITR